MAMDPPERNQINPSLSRGEDSHVFSFISGLSPIKPVKSDQIGQKFRPLSFPSPPRVFNSPHVNRFKDSKLLRSHNPFGATSEDVNKFQTSEEAIADSFHDLIALPGENTEFSAEIPQALKYNNCGNPGYDPGHEANSLVGLLGEETTNFAYVQQLCRIDSNEVLNQQLVQFDPKGQQSECNLDNLISGDNDFFLFDSPNEAAAFKGIMQIPDSHFMPLVPESSIYNILRDDSKPEIEDYCPEPLAVAYQMQDKHYVDMTLNTKEKADDELAPVMNCGKWRRCLDFERVSEQRKTSDNNLKSGSLGHSDEKQLVSAKHNSSSQQAVGLHLNAHAALKEDKNIIDNDKLPCEVHLNLPGCTSLQIYTSHEHQDPLLAMVVDSSDIGVAEDCSYASNSTVNDVNQNSPEQKKHKMDSVSEIGDCSKQKKHKIDSVSEIGNCKRCNCKKSKCLKLYCECFAARGYCTDNCSCQNCDNKLIHKDKVLKARNQIESRSPLAFAPKVISEPEIENDPNKTPAPARHRHKRGCNCKKSLCQKKYCECFEAGVGCSISCRCEGCKNTFGRKDGSNAIGVEVQPEEETEACEKAVVEKASQKVEDQNLEDRPNTSWSQPSQHFQPLSNEERPDFSGGGGRSDKSPMTCIKTTSPNGKRISSPKSDSTPSSQVRKLGRKLHPFNSFP